MDEKYRKGWRNLLTNGLQEFDGKSNTRFDFKTMTKRFGRYYLDYLSTAYAAKDDMPETEFRSINGNIPGKFMSKVKQMSLKEKMSVR